VVTIVTWGSVVIITIVTRDDCRRKKCTIVMVLYRKIVVYVMFGTSNINAIAKHSSYAIESSSAFSFNKESLLFCNMKQIVFVMLLV